MGGGRVFPQAEGKGLREGRQEGYQTDSLSDDIISDLRGESSLTKGQPGKKRTVRGGNEPKYRKIAVSEETPSDPRRRTVSQRKTWVCSIGEGNEGRGGSLLQESRISWKRGEHA